MKRFLIPTMIFSLIFVSNGISIGGCLGDFNGDGDVDASDLGFFAAEFGRTDCEPCVNEQIRCVGRDETIQSVVDSIADASENNPYVILIPPGVHDCTNAALVLEEHIHLKGYGPGATTIKTANWNNILAASNCSINNLSIKYSGSGQGAITKESPITNFILNRVEFEISGDNAAIYFVSRGSFVVYMYDVKIVTEGTGIYTDTWGHYYLHDVDIFLTGDSIGAPHIGVWHKGGARFYLWGSKIGTGYGYPNITNDTGQDVIGIYIPSSNVNNPRIEIHGLESFCRNEGAGEGVNVNVIRAEAGWVRCFGCFGQAETPPDWSIGKCLYQSNEGKIETFGCRFSSYQGNIFGAPQRGVSTYNTSDNNHTLNKFEGGLVLLDGTDGPFTIKLRQKVRNGEEIIFKKIDSSVNRLTISGNGGTIDGAPSKTLISQYQILRIIGGYNEWYTY